MAKKKKLPIDTNLRAKSIVDIVTNEQPEAELNELRSAASQLGRKGGLKGGPARAKKLSSKRRSAIARKAALARWSKRSK